MNEKINRGRIEYYDILKGLAIVSVVAIHEISFSIVKGIEVSPFIVFWRNLLCFAVPLFITISGFFVANKSFSSKSSYVDYLKKQVPRILIPYLFWALFYSFFLFLRGIPLLSILFKLFTFQTAVPFYFMALILQFYILAPFAQKLANRKGLVGTAILSVLFCLIIYYIRYFLGIKLPIILYGGTFFPYLFFFVLGIYFGNGKVIWKGRLSAVILVIGALALLTSDSIMEYKLYGDLNAAVSAMRITSLIYSFAVINFLFNTKNLGFKNAALSYLGVVSFGIYFMHIFFMTKLTGLLKIYLPSLGIVEFQVIIIISILLLCTLICWLARRINRNIAVKYLGL